MRPRRRDRPEYVLPPLVSVAIITALGIWGLVELWLG